MLSMETFFRANGREGGLIVDLKLWMGQVLLTMKELTANEVMKLCWKSLVAKLNWRVSIAGARNT